MTFSILAADPIAGQYGYGFTTSTPAASDLCATIVPGRGVLSVQAAGDPGQHALAGRLVEIGFSPDQVIAALESDPLVEHRQLVVVSASGSTAVRTGAEAWGWAGDVVGKHHVAAANSVVSSDVTSAMSTAFIDSEREDLAERLMRAIEAGRDAGGQPDGQISAAVKVYGPRSSSVNLKVDVHPEPVGHLRSIFDWYKTLRPHYQAYSEDNHAWDLDSWGALDRAGKSYFPEGAGFDPELVARREEEIRAWRLVAAAAAAEGTA